MTVRDEDSWLKSLQNQVAHSNRLGTGLIGFVSLLFIPGVSKLFTRRARFGETVEAAGRMLIEKQGEELFFGDHGPHANVISEIEGFHLVFIPILYR